MVLVFSQIIHRVVDKSVGMPVGRSRSGPVSRAARQISPPRRVRIDILTNNAGVAKRASIAVTIGSDDLAKVVDGRG
jgi:hypothetical protein